MSEISDGSFAHYFVQQEKKPVDIVENIRKQFGLARMLHADARTSQAIEAIKIHMNNGGAYNHLHAKLLLAKLHIAILKGEF